MKTKEKIITIFAIVLTGLICIAYINVNAEYVKPEEIPSLPKTTSITKIEKFNSFGVNTIYEFNSQKKELAEEVIIEEAIEDEEIIVEEDYVYNIISNYTNDETTQNYIYYAWSFFSEYGWSEYDLECLVYLWHRESNWNPLAHNSSSGAHGIPQSLPAEKMATHGANYWDNPYTQINWGLDYIYDRYGNPASAWYHSEQTGWY